MIKTLSVTSNESITINGKVLAIIIPSGASFSKLVLGTEDYYVANWLDVRNGYYPVYVQGRNTIGETLQAVFDHPYVKVLSVEMVSNPDTVKRVELVIETSVIIEV